MSEINNIVFEGRVISAPEVINEKGEKYVRFSIQNRREGIATTMPVLSHGDLAQKVLEAIMLEQIVRVVGHLTKRNGELYIMIYHVEYKYVVFKNLVPEEDEQC